MIIVRAGPALVKGKNSMPVSEIQFPAAYWSAPGALLYLGDVRAQLKRLPARSVHCVVTSPPYWNQRQYCVGREEEIGGEKEPDCLGWAQDLKGRGCGSCFVCHMLDVFGEVRRVLRNDGTLWLNLGDSFDGGQKLVPARTALALQEHRWRMVQDIIWYAPNKMPESVTNRCTKSHEHIFLLTKSQEYYYDSLAIATKGAIYERHRRDGERPDETKMRGGRQQAGSDGQPNKRDVWVVPVSRYPGAHTATFSPELITPCILAGTSEHGCCIECERPYERSVVKVGGATAVSDMERDRSLRRNRNGITGSLDGTPAKRETVGWQKMCGCQTAEVVPCRVLDPFVGSGTTIATANQLGRDGIGIDLSEQYLRENAIPRILAAHSGEKIKRRTVVTREGTPLPAKKIEIPDEREKRA